MLGSNQQDGRAFVPALESLGMRRLPRFLRESGEEAVGLERFRSLGWF
jgi:hypothetical protein